MVSDGGNKFDEESSYPVHAHVIFNFLGNIQHISVGHSTEKISFLIVWSSRGFAWCFVGKSLDDADGSNRNMKKLFFLFDKNNNNTRHRKNHEVFFKLTSHTVY